VTRERDIESYLVRRIRALGGEIRKVGWIGRRGAPDRFVMLPGDQRNCWVELKAPGKHLQDHQTREILRMKGLGEIVLVIDSFELVDICFPGPWVPQ